MVPFSCRKHGPWGCFSFTFGRFGVVHLLRARISELSSLFHASCLKHGQAPSGAVWMWGRALGRLFLGRGMSLGPIRPKKLLWEQPLAHVGEQRGLKSSCHVRRENRLDLMGFKSSLRGSSSRGNASARGGETEAGSEDSAERRWLSNGLGDSHGSSPFMLAFSSLFSSPSGAWQ